MIRGDFSCEILLFFGSNKFDMPPPNFVIPGGFIGNCFFPMLEEISHSGIGGRRCPSWNIIRRGSSPVKEILTR